MIIDHNSENQLILLCQHYAVLTILTDSLNYDQLFYIRMTTASASKQNSDK